MTRTLLLSAIVTALTLWGLALAAIPLRTRPWWRHLGTGAAVAGWLVVVGAILGLWLDLGRPPLRTLGETRLWYAALVAGIGLALEWRLRLTVLRLPMLAMAGMFLALDLFRPDALDRTLRPALHSAWFVPHVATYLAAYALLGLACATALHGWWCVRRGELPAQAAAVPVLLVDLGLPLLTLGMILGAVWAKQAWGHYWAWDPKETWALATWVVYVGIVHFTRLRPDAHRTHLTLIAVAFATVCLCWFAVQWLPSAVVSVHTYTSD